MMPEEAASLAELQAISAFLSREGRAEGAVLVGGWAVHAVAPYLFSRDIDLVLRRVERRKLLAFLKGRGYRPAAEAAPETARADASMAREALPGFTLYIDIASVAEENRFARSSAQAIPWELAFQSARRMGIPGVEGGFRVCGRATLLAYKLKALNDREFRASAEGDPGGRLMAKAFKDSTDALALLLTAAPPSPPLLASEFSAAVAAAPLARDELLNLAGRQEAVRRYTLVSALARTEVESRIADAVRALLGLA